jgi:hypothetical protein
MTFLAAGFANVLARYAAYRARQVFPPAGGDFATAVDTAVTPGAVAHLVANLPDSSFGFHLDVGLGHVDNFEYSSGYPMHNGVCAAGVANRRLQRRDHSAVTSEKHSRFNVT